jgi:hypothetical protein
MRWRLLRELNDFDRPLFATALYAGLRKGELFGMRKSDVDLKRRLLMVRRSYDRETTKGAREEAVPIAAALVPFLESALDASRGALLFPRPDGEMRTEEDKLGKRLRSALNRAGIVDGYLHVCRRRKRNGMPHEERHPDCERRRCPTCKMLLLHAQIDWLPKLDQFAALALHEAPKTVQPPRGQLLDRPDSRVVQMARLAGVEPAARGFEGRTSDAHGVARVRNLLQ